MNRWLDYDKVHGGQKGRGLLSFLLFIVSWKWVWNGSFGVEVSNASSEKHTICLPSEAEVHHSVAMSVKRVVCSKSLCLNHRFVPGWWLMTNGTAWKLVLLKGENSGF